MAKRKRKNKKKTRKQYAQTLSLLLIVLALSYFIFSSNLLKPKIDEITMSYISFNNSYSTDMLKINNIQRMSDEKGKSSKNKNKINLKITGKQASEYQVIVYSINNEIDSKYIKFNVEDRTTQINNTLSEMPLSKDGGRILYTGNTSNSMELILKMWVSTDYKNKINDNSYEIKIIEKV